MPPTCWLPGKSEHARERARQRHQLRGRRVGRTRTASSRNPGTSSRRVGSISASAKRMRAAQAEDSAMTVILPLSSEQRFTLFASSGPSAFSTATCHSDVPAASSALSTSVGRRAEIKSATVLGAPPIRTVCLSRRGLLGIVSRLLARVVSLDRFLKERTTRMPAMCNSLKHKEQDLQGPVCHVPPELAR